MEQYLQKYILCEHSLKKVNIITKGYTDLYSDYIVLNIGHTVTKMRGSESDPWLMKEDINYSVKHWYKNLKMAKKKYFNHLLTHATPESWSKYTTSVKYFAKTSFQNSVLGNNLDRFHIKMWQSFNKIYLI